MSFFDKRKGISLLETLLVLTIVAVITVAGFRQLRSYQFQSSLAEFKASIATVHAGAVEYYQTLCGDPASSWWDKGTYLPPVMANTPISDDMFNKKIIDEKELVNPFASFKNPTGRQVFSVYLNCQKQNNVCQRYYLYIFANFGSTGKDAQGNGTCSLDRLDQFKNLTRANAVDAAACRIRWDVFPFESSAVQASGNSDWILRHQVNKFAKTNTDLTAKAPGSDNPIANCYAVTTGSTPR